MYLFTPLSFQRIHYGKEGEHNFTAAKLTSAISVKWSRSISTVINHVYHDIVCPWYDRWKCHITSVLFLLNIHSLSVIIRKYQPSVVAQGCSPSSQEAEAGVAFELRVQDQHGQCRETPRHHLQKKKTPATFQERDINIPENCQACLKTREFWETVMLWSECLSLKIIVET